MEYVLSPKPDQCIFCLGQDVARDEERYVLKRSTHCFVVLNRYPYSPGHIMVAPYRHEETLTSLSEKESHDLMDSVRQSVAALTRGMGPDGINVGLNIGAAAGAGIASHLHMHVVPRWTGDHSFMAVTGRTMVLSEHLDDQFERLKPFFS